MNIVRTAIPDVLVIEPKAFGDDRGFFFESYNERGFAAQNRRMVWVPPGFAHGFLVTSEYADFLNKTTDYWALAHERCILWNDPDLDIPWPLDGEPVLSAKDRVGQPLHTAEVFP